MGRAREATGAVTVFYCATCGVVYAEDRDGRTGLRFLCPNDAPDRPAHLASVVKGPSGRRWLSVQRWLARYDDRYSPRNWFGMWGGLFAGRVGFYVVVRLLALLAALALVAWDRGPGPTVAGVVVSAFAVGSVLDILLVHTHIAFVRRSTADPLRATVLALFSFAQLAVAFAVVYAVLGATFQPPLPPFRALYFSFVTISTLGYGDFRPADDAWLAQAAVVAELICGLYFLAVVVAIVTSWAHTPPAVPKLRPLADLLPLPPDPSSHA